MKQTIAIKNTEHVRATKQIDKIEKEKSALKHELQSATVAVQHARTELAEREHECRQLYRAVAEEERKCTKSVKKVDGVVNEKDILGAEMVKKKQEISLLKDKRALALRALDRGKENIFVLNIFYKGENISYEFVYIFIP